MNKRIYPRSGDTQIVYLKSVISRQNIEVGYFTISGERDTQTILAGYYSPVAKTPMVEPGYR